ncbi:MAG: glycosyltransferase [Deltaproteobacteria bacterium]|jgi:radical SAM superfamily enzyme YgiQ (UPF0313 family)/glycosyltransferase involved in cell wall biosynthesis|nr:glycosyltransferase [Deltaproteobacteria bacterium]
MNVLMLTSPAPARAGFSTSEKRPPLGVGTLIAILERAGHTVQFDDQYLAPWPIFDSPAFLAKHKIEVVGIYCNTICLQGTLSLVRKLQYLREHGLWKGRIAVGGPHTSYGAESLPEYIDHICIGEGDITFPEMINGQEKRRIAVGKKVEDLDSLPMPAWRHFIYRGYNWSSPWDEGYPMYTMNTSRGCPFSCTFCSVKGVWGRTYRFMSAERVMEDVEVMRRYYGMQAAYFREDHFTLDRQRTLGFCEGLLRRGMVFPWLCESRADSIDSPEVIELMAKAGCKALYIGVESGSQRMLDLLKKHEQVEQFERVIKKARACGIRTYASMIYGVPGETEEDVARTEAFLARANPHYVGRNIFAGLPGSELYDELRATGRYDYEDENGLLYPEGYEERARRAYGHEYFAVVSKALGTPAPATPNQVMRAAKTPEVSVIMPAGNAAAFAAEAVQSILGQSFGDFELLLLDDASTDDTWQLFQAQRDPRIYLHRNETRLGVSAGLNKLLGQARGRFIARMDADDLSAPGRLAAQVDFMRRNPDIWVCGGAYTAAEGERKWHCAPPATDAAIKAGLLFDNNLAHPFVMLNGEKFKEHGIRYDEKMTAAQDYELWLRLLRQCPEARFANLARNLGQYRRLPGAVSTARADEKRAMQFRALMPVFGKLGFSKTDQSLGLHKYLRFSEEVESETGLARVFEWALQLRRANAAHGLFAAAEFDSALTGALAAMLERNKRFAGAGARLFSSWAGAVKAGGA